MASIPREHVPDSSIALAMDPYCFISRRCRRLGTDVFQTRIVLQRTICMMGREAAELFYDESRFIRHGASPMAIQRTLFGKGGVQTLDDEAHRHRKAMFVSIVTPQAVEQLGATFEHRWLESVERGQGGRRMVVYDEARQVITRAVCEWAGVPLPEHEVATRTDDLASLFEHAGSFGPAHLKAHWARRRANRWGEQIIDAIRSGELDLPETAPARVIAFHRNLKGELLPPHVAAVELLNILRPTVAVALWVTFVFHALHEHVDASGQLDPADDRHVESFAQEVRRFYPFFPAAVALVRRDFEWRGYTFKQGTRCMLDLYGTGHDERVWTAPELFLPQRFRQKDPSPFEFIPQGGADVKTQHRCPGEGIALDIMKRTIRLATTRMSYDVPRQDLTVNTSTLPAMPRSRFVMQNVKLR